MSGGGGGGGLEGLRYKCTMYMSGGGGGGGGTGRLTLQMYMSGGNWKANTTNVQCTCQGGGGGGTGRLTLQMYMSGGNWKAYPTNVHVRGGGGGWKAYQSVDIQLFQCWECEPHSVVLRLEKERGGGGVNEVCERREGCACACVSEREYMHEWWYSIQVKAIVPNPTSPTKVWWQTRTWESNWNTWPFQYTLFNPQ